MKSWKVERGTNKFKVDTFLCIRIHKHKFAFFSTHVISHIKPAALWSGQNPAFSTFWWQPHSFWLEIPITTPPTPPQLWICECVGLNTEDNFGVCTPLLCGYFYVPKVWDIQDDISSQSAFFMTIIHIFKYSYCNPFSPLP